MAGDEPFTDVEFQALHRILWEWPLDDVEPETLASLEARGCIRSSTDAWFITYTGHQLFLKQRATTF